MCPHATRDQPRVHRLLIGKLAVTYREIHERASQEFQVSSTLLGAALARRCWCGGLRMAGDMVGVRRFYGLDGALCR